MYLVCMGSILQARGEQTQRVGRRLPDSDLGGITEPVSCMTAIIEGVYLVRWQKPEITDLQRVQAEVAGARARLDSPLAYVAIVPGDAEPPETEVRKFMMDSMDEVLKHCQAMHFAIEGTGFKHSVLRSALAGILLVAGRRGRVFVHRSAEVATREACRTLGIEPTHVLQRARTQKLL